MLAPEGLQGLPFPIFEGSFTPWENLDDLLSPFQPTHPSQDHPVHSNNSGSDEPSSQAPVSVSVSVSVSAVDERKQRRMESNRESARRSRLRKQKHLEGLRNKVNRLRNENREIANRLEFLTGQSLLIRRDNDRLRSESVALRQRLSNMHRILVVRQLQHHLLLSSPSPCNNSFSSVYEVNEQLPSLIA